MLAAVLLFSSREWKRDSYNLFQAKVSEQNKAPTATQTCKSVVLKTFTNQYTIGAFLIEYQGVTTTTINISLKLLRYRNMQCTEM